MAECIIKKNIAYFRAGLTMLQSSNGFGKSKTPILVGCVILYSSYPRGRNYMKIMIFSRENPVVSETSERARRVQRGSVTLAIALLPEFLSDVLKTRR